MFTKTFFSAVAASVLFAASASAICPGYKFGIAQDGGQMNGNNGVWQVYDNSCNVVHQATGQMPCGWWRVRLQLCQDHLHLAYISIMSTMLAAPTLTLILAMAKLFKSVATEQQLTVRWPSNLRL
ncbi:hypothetical protein BKA82DRAFT_4342991 [Pisolithus tinctorius]|nr:hypothetical protein BKA82DRAFT_4342991 [Pisolithus tinctorius]